MKKILALLLITTAAIAQDSSRVLVGSAQPPLPYNIIPQPGFEQRTTGWSATGGVFTVTSTTANVARGTYSAQWTLPVSSAVGYLLQSNSVTIPAGIFNASCRVQILYKGNAATNGQMYVEAYDGTNILGSTALSDVTYYTYLQSSNFTCPTSGTLRLRIRNNTNGPLVPTPVYFDEMTLGAAFTFPTSTGGDVIGPAGSTLYNLAYYNSTSGKLLGTNDNLFYSSNGLLSVAATSQNASQSTFNSTATDTGVAAGGSTYAISANAVASGSGSLTNMGGINPKVTINSGATVGGAYGVLAQLTNSATTGSIGYGFRNTVSNSGTLSNYYGAYLSSSSGTVTTNNYALYVASGNSFFTGNALFNTATANTFAGFDSSKNLVTKSFTAPTIQKFTSSSGTYTTPAGVLYIRVKMVGGGGGGGGAGVGATAGNASTAATASTFGTTLLSAGAGGGGPANAGGIGGVGGTSSLGSGPIGTALTGGQGAGGVNAISGAAIPGGIGAASAFGGGGSSFTSVTGTAGAANTGAGGGGGSPNANNITGGAGGGAGGFVDALISSPSATYSYVVGVGGSGGTAGTSGTAGGAGGSGYIEVTEYYQ